MTGGVQQTDEIVGQEHWVSKRTSDGEARLFTWRKRTPAQPERGTILFVHGSSMGSIPSFDLQVPGGPSVSAMDYFAKLGYDTWTFDHEGYRRSRGSRDVSADIPMGADDIAAVTDYIRATTGVEQVLAYGVSSGALRAALFTQRHPERVKRLALDAFVWTGQGSRTLEQRRLRLAEFEASSRRPIDRAFLTTIFTRDHPGSASDDVIDAFIDTVLAHEDSVPNGTYLDMCRNLPVVDPHQIRVPTIILRGQYDGIAGFDDLLEFFKQLPNPDKQFAVMPGIAHGSFTQKNHQIVKHTLAGFFSQPEPVYAGEE
ncbi:MAG: alpha/beta fold hydrolase [Chloroflexi bacterium]|nr:alpha/beta fold hydrolase [Chloroflexota bacterium]MBV9597153.1 alpha/beta fold hydrolase [Chloroflexota bacterium]